jgi:4-hydroxy-tetrahydrodipicolinate synthase
MRLAGTYVAMITPFTGDDVLDIPGVHANVDWWVDEGVHGLLAGGSVGEATQLDDREWDTLIRVTVAAARGRVPVIAGCSADSTAEAIRRIRHAAAHGAAAALVGPPSYTHATDREIAGHFAAVAEVSPLPIMVDNDGSTTGARLGGELIERIAAPAGVHYVVETGPSARRVESIRRRTGATVFAASRLRPSLLAGAAGWVSVAANIAPGLCARLYAESVTGAPAAAEIDHRLADLMALQEEVGKPVQVAKEALALLGRPAGAPRRPRLGLTDVERHWLRRVVDGLAAPVAESLV